MSKAPPVSVSLTAAAKMERHIYVIRGRKVMLDSDLAALYEIPTKQFNRAVQRNTMRFPEDFMFQITEKESEYLRSQIVTSNDDPLRCQSGTSNTKRGGRRYLPYVFTEHGVAMLSSVLKSERAVQMSITIVRAFVRLREMIATDKDFARRIEKLEAGQDKIGSVIDVLVDEIDAIAREVHGMKNAPVPARRKIGFEL